MLIVAEPLKPRATSAEGDRLPAVWERYENMCTWKKAQYKLASVKITSILSERDRRDASAAGSVPMARAISVRLKKSG